MVASDGTFDAGINASLICVVHRFSFATANTEPLTIENLKLQIANFFAVELQKLSNKITELRIAAQRDRRTSE